MNDYDNIKIIDDYFPKELFKQIETMIMHPSSRFPWFYMDSINGKGYDIDKDVFQFVNTIFPTHDIQDITKYREFVSILDNMDNKVLMRAKVNCLTRTKKIIKHGFHIDILDEEDKTITTAILYINTNNGYTHFKNGTKVKSKANRLVCFPHTYLHCGTTCTDKNIRVVMNLNYLEI